MRINKHLDKNNLHHAYLIEGKREEILGEISKFIESIGIKVLGNADVVQISLDSFKIEDARNLKSYASEMSFSYNLPPVRADGAQAGKKIFIISANNFLLEAQNSLLKLFEDPIENTHFFVITPDSNNLLKTLVSRFYFISAISDPTEELRETERFVTMPLRARIDFIKDLLAEPDEEVASVDSARSKSLKFLNALESTLHKKLTSKTTFDTRFFEHFFKVREFLRMPGSSAKSLMESVAMVIPIYKDMQSR